jgi:hypothetical protein
MTDEKIEDQADPPPAPPSDDPQDSDKGAVDAPQGEQGPEPDRVDLPDAGAIADFATFSNALREAIAVFGGRITIGNLFLGNTTAHSVVGGGIRGEDSRSHPSSGAIRSPGGPITPEELEVIDGTFVPPECFDAADTRLRASSLLLLRAKPGWGRTTFALKLLAPHCAGGLHELEAETLLGWGELPALEKQRGYLLGPLDLQQSATLRSRRLARLSRHLRDAGAMMVVVLDHGFLPREGDVEDYLVEGASPAPPADVVRRHLCWQLKPLVPTGDVDRRAAELLDDDHVSTLVAELSSSRARDLVSFAADLARAHDGAVAVDDIVNRHAQSAAGRFADWFDVEQDIEQRALVIAIAVFHAMPLHLVNRAARRLAERMREAENPDPKLLRRTLFGLPMRERLDAAKAELVPGTESARYGRIAVPLVRFRNDALPQRVLEYVWQQHDQAYEVVREWLRDLGVDPNPAVRARAGAAVGLLSRVDFDHVRHVILIPWADCGALPERQAAVAALQLAALEPGLGPLVGRLILDWLGPHQPINRRITAVAALGAISVLTPERALRGLRRAVRDAPALIGPTAASLTQLFLSTEMQARMLTVLHRWSLSPHKNLRRAAHLATLRIADEVVVDPDGAASPWPAVVWLADGTAHHADIVTLFAVLFDAPFTSEPAYKLVRRWVRLAGRDEEFIPPLKRFLAALVAETKDPANLRWYLAEWREEKDAPVAVVDELIASIDEVEITHDPGT